jgi:outer membrane protein TolC
VSRHAIPAPARNARRLIAAVGLAAALPAQALGAEPLSLARAKELAMAASGSVAIKSLDEKRAEAALAEAKALRGPKASITASGSYLANPPEGVTIRQGDLGIAPMPGSQYPVSYPAEDYVLIKDTENSYFKLTVNGSLPVFTWGKLEKGVAIAQAGLEASRDASAGGKSDASLDAAKAYLAAAFARSTSARLKETVSALEERLASDQAAFDSGAITLQDLLESRSSLSRARSAAVKAAEGLSTSLAAISYLTGLGTPDSADLTDGLDAFAGTEGGAYEETPEDELLGRALSSSARIKEVDSQAKVASLYADVLKASGPFRPDIQLQAMVDVTGQQIPLLSSNWTDTWDWNLVLTLGGQMSLYDSGEAKAKLDQALSQAESARRGLAELKRSMPLSVRRAVESARAARAIAAEKADALALAAEQEKNARVSRENDLLTRKDELGATVARLAAETELDLASFDLGNALIELERLCPK